jgi:hypothetical protein
LLFEKNFGGYLPSSNLFNEQSPILTNEEADTFHLTFTLKSAFCHFLECRKATNGAQESHGPGFVRMKTACFERLSPHTELMPGRTLHSISPVGTSASAGIDGSITWKIRRLSASGVSMRTSC